MKRIAVFADGTWASPEVETPTNVLRLARAVQPSAARNVEQMSFYDWGVATDRRQVLGSISGAGIDKNIMDCYRFIVHNYDEGDELYLFGFSRGAYTARSLAGLIRNCGLLQRRHADRIPEAYRLYRRRSKSSSPDAERSARFRRDYAVADITRIRFVGVWDTVGALGIPLPFWGTLGAREFLFHDTEPSKIIEHARHAVSIDENRADYEPSLWSEKPGLDLQQVWFAGVHSDVGGGYRERGLSDCAIEWIVGEASRCGLAFEAHLVDAVRPDFSDRLHNARKGIFLARPSSVRRVTGPVHASAKRRWDADVNGYRNKSKALAQALEAASGDWTRLGVTPDSDGGPG